MSGQRQPSEIVYPPPGACIYCGSPNVVGREHIVPEGLGGAHVIELASCRCCEVIIGRYEVNVLRRLLGNFRVARRAPSKHPNRKKPKSRIRYSIGDGPMIEYEVEPHEVPRTLALPRFVPPSIIYDPAPRIHLESVGIWAVTDVNGPQVPGNHEWSDTFIPGYFIRWLCKIGHGFARAVLTPEEVATFTEFLPKAILDEKVPIGHLVGSLPDHPPIEGIYTFGFAMATRDQTEYFCVNFWPYCWLGAPSYQIVYGARPTGSAIPRILIPGNFVSIYEH